MRIYPRFSPNSTVSSLSGLALQQAAKAKPQFKSGLDITELMRGLPFRGDCSERTCLHSGILLPLLVQGGFASGVCRSQVRQTPGEFIMDSQPVLLLAACTDC